MSYYLAFEKLRFLSFNEIVFISRKIRIRVLELDKNYGFFVASKNCPYPKNSKSLLQRFNGPKIIFHQYKTLVLNKFKLEIQIIGVKPNKVIK